MKRVLVFIADGTEEVEAVTVVDYLRRAGIQVDLVSVMEDKEVTGSHDIKLVADYLLEDIDPKDYDAVYSPGGLPGAYNIRDNERVIEIYQEMAGEGKIVSALCAGPTILDEAGLLKGKNFVAFPGFVENIKDGTYVDKNVVVDGNVMTGRGPGLAAEFAYELIGQLTSQDKKDQIMEETLYSYIEN